LQGRGTPALEQIGVRQVVSYSSCEILFRMSPNSLMNSVSFLVGSSLQGIFDPPIAERHLA
jgi:hypothetical protein